MIFRSIRWRLQAWHGLLLVVVLAGFALTAYHVAQDNQLRRIDQELEHRLMVLFRPEPPRRRLEPPPEGRPGPANHFDPQRMLTQLCAAIDTADTSGAGQTNAFYYILWDGAGAVLATSPGAPVGVQRPVGDALLVPGRPDAELEPGAHGGPTGPRPGPPLIRTIAERREMYRFLPHGNCLLVGHLMGPEIAAMHRLGFWLGVAGAGVLLLGLAGGWWLATRAIRPIEAISAAALKIAAGDLSHRINAADADNELGRLANVLNSTFARLEAAFAHQARFTSDASHELRTPVSVILTQTQAALSRERSPGEYREALEACQRAAQRMRNLTNSLLELARLDAGQEPLKREPFDLSRVAQDCVELVRPLAAERQVQLHCELSSARCLGDAERIGQVVTNLLSNAIYFNRPAGEVRVLTRAENGTVLLTVSDTGQGIPPEDIPHIFERFYRVDKSRSRIQGRTGLGLAISKAIAEAHTGSLEVLSQPGVGTTFTVKLPAPPAGA